MENENPNTTSLSITGNISNSVIGAIPQWIPTQQFRWYVYKQDRSQLVGNSIETLHFPPAKPTTLQQLWYDGISRKYEWRDIPYVVEGSPEDKLP